MVRNLLTALAIVAMLGACATSPTGQRQLRLFPEAQMNAMGVAAFEETKRETPLSGDGRDVAYVRCVTEAVAREANTSIPWEVQVFDGEQANAFALPGGKIGVYTGMLDVAANQHQLAAVLAHEVAHVTARHGNARVSAAYATQAGLEVARIVAGATSPAQQQLFGLLGLGAQYGIVMPYGRAQETEADVLGLDLMARAGFDPRQAPELWRNMAGASGRASGPEFLSTHPAGNTRIATLESRMPAALRHFEAARAAGKQPRCG